MSSQIPGKPDTVVNISEYSRRNNSSIDVKDSTEKINTILSIESIESLILHQKYSQFRKLSFFQLTKTSDPQKRIILQAIRDTMKNIILDKRKKEPSMMVIIFIQKLYEELLLFSQQLERDYDLIFFSDEYTQEINNLFAESMSNYLYIQPGDINEKYKDAAYIYSNLSSKYQDIDGFSLYPEMVKGIISHYFNNVFTSLLDYANYDGLKNFCMSDDGFKKELDIDFIKLKLFNDMRLIFEVYTSQSQAKDMKDCIEALCKFFEETDKYFFTGMYLPKIEEIFSKLPELDNLVQFPGKDSGGS